MATHAPLFDALQPGPAAQVTARKSVPAKAKKKLIRRTEIDHSQLYRRTFQGAFFLLNLWLGTRFYFWVRQFETGNLQASLQRPAGIEGWLPIAGLMNLRYWLLSGQIPQLHPAAMFLLLTFLALPFLFRKPFCCGLSLFPTLSGFLWGAGKNLSAGNVLQGL